MKCLILTVEQTGDTMTWKDNIKKRESFNFPEEDDDKEDIIDEIKDMCRYIMTNVDKSITLKTLEETQSLLRQAYDYLNNHE